MNSDEPDPDAPAFILQTSGTTAKPKFDSRSHRNMLAAAERVQVWFELTPQDRCLSVSPVYLCSRSGGHGVYAPAHRWHGRISNRCFKIRLFRMVRCSEATWYSAGPTLHRIDPRSNEIAERMRRRGIRCASFCQVARRSRRNSRGPAACTRRSCVGPLWF